VLLIMNLGLLCGERDTASGVTLLVADWFSTLVIDKPIKKGKVEKSYVYKIIKVMKKWNQSNLLEVTQFMLIFLILHTSLALLSSEVRCNPACFCALILYESNLNWLSAIVIAPSVKASAGTPPLAPSQTLQHFTVKQTEVLFTKLLMRHYNSI